MKFLFSPQGPKGVTFDYCKEAEPPKLILISACWVCTPIICKIMDMDYAPLIMFN